MKVYTCLKEKMAPEVKYTFSLFFITRIILTIIGVFSRILLEPFHGKQYIWIFSKYLCLDIWGVWDTELYLEIAERGYPISFDQPNYGLLGFFPFYPLLIRFLGKILGNYFLAGIILSNTSLIVAAVFLYKLVRLDSKESTALNSIKYLFLFPTGFIFSGVFSEPLFLALTLLSFYYAKKENWFFVGILGFFLSLTRPVGVFLIFPLLYEYFRVRDFKLKKAKLDILFFALNFVRFIFLFWLSILSNW